MNDKIKDIPKEELLDCYNIIDGFLKFLDEELEKNKEGEQE